MAIVEFCPACKSKNVQYQSSTYIAGLTNMLYHCLDCGAFITKNEYSQPLVSYVVDSKTRKPVKLDGSHKSSSQGGGEGGCCSLAILFILFTFASTALTLFLHL